MKKQFSKHKPALLLDFQKSKNVHPAIKVIRESDAQIHAGSGILTVVPNVPRVFTNYGGQKAGLRNDSASTNLWVRSARFDPLDWRYTAGSNYVLSSGVDIDGSLTTVLTEKVTTAVASIGSRKLFNIEVASNTHVSTQMRLIPGGRRFVSALVVFVVNATEVQELVSTIVIDTLTGQTRAGGAGIAESAWRVSKNADGSIFVGFTGKTNASGIKATSYMDIRPSPFDDIQQVSNFGSSYIGDGRVCFAVTDSQLELTRGNTSLIPTDGVSVSRASENIRLDPAFFATIYNHEEGAILCESDCNGVVIWQLGTGGTSRIFLEHNVANPTGRAIVNIDAKGSIFGASSPNIRGKTAFSYKKGYFTFVDANGTVYQGGDGTEHEPANTIHIGHSGTGVYNANGTIQTLSYYNKALTVEEMKAFVGK